VSETPVYWDEAHERESVRRRIFEGLNESFGFPEAITGGEYRAALAGARAAFLYVAKCNGTGPDDMVIECRDVVKECEEYAKYMEGEDEP